MVYAAAAIKASGIKLFGDIIVAGNPMEETSGADGTIYMLDVDNIKADGAICGEATGLGIYLGHRGNAEVKLTVKGVMAHASNPTNGINAAIKASQLVCYIMDHYKLPRHELLGQCTATILDIKADTERKAPVLPDRCFVYVDRRFLPGETKDDSLREFAELVTEAKKEIQDLDVDIEITKWGLALFTPEENPVTQALIAARTKALGEAGKLSAWIFGTDGAFIADRGIPCVGFGPGDEAFAHTPEDHISIEDLDKATKVYTQIALEFCK
jgi:acetylornithine deacetylase/succinyl-diaminopimelate desuccinylase-like protein